MSVLDVAVRKGIKPVIKWIEVKMNDDSDTYLISVNQTSGMGHRSTHLKGVVHGNYSGFSLSDSLSAISVLFEEEQQSRHQ